MRGKDTVRKKYILAAWFICLAFFGWLILTSEIGFVSAQSPLRWSIPRRIPGYADDTWPPYLVIDQNRTVHAFTSQGIGAEVAVFYNQWSPNGVWTRPVDILLSPRAGQAFVQGAYLDPQGMMHVIFYGGNDQGGEYYYSQAPAVKAAQAPSWSPAKLVGPQGANPPSAILKGDGKGNLFILYSGNREGNGLYEVHSTDGGSTWSEPAPIFLTNSSTLWVFGIQSVFDAQGRLHVVWTVVNKAGNGEAVYYARLGSDRKQWSLPLALQTLKGNDYEADWAFIIPFNDELFVIYNYGFPPRRWMRRSSDGGKTWTEPVVAFDSKGEYGHAALVVDSANTLHILVGNRTSDDSLYGIWHGTWLGDKWSALEPVVSGPLTPTFGPSHPRAVVVQGNTILVTWRTDPGQTASGVWYSSAALDAPELPTAALPTPVATGLPTPTLTATPLPVSPTPTRAAVALLSTPETPSPFAEFTRSPTGAIGIAVVPVFVLLMLLFLVRNLRRSF